MGWEIPMSFSFISYDTPFICYLRLCQVWGRTVIHFYNICTIKRYCNDGAKRSHPLIIKFNNPNYVERIALTPNVPYLHKKTQKKICRTGHPELLSRRQRKWTVRNRSKMSELSVRTARWSSNPGPRGLNPRADRSTPDPRNWSNCHLFKTNDQ